MIARYPVSDRNVLVIGICNFDIVCHLIIGIWDFSVLSLKANRLYLNQLELTLTDPWASRSCDWNDGILGFYSNILKNVMRQSNHGSKKYQQGI